MKRNRNVESFIKKLVQTESYRLFVEETSGAVGNTTNNIDGYDTKYAFAKDEESHESGMKDIMTTAGYTAATKKSKRNFESHKKNGAQLSEISYKEFKRSSDAPANRKISEAINQIDRNLREIERSVRHASRLKTELSVDQRTIWKSSLNRVVKIAERLVRIRKMINELGA